MERITLREASERTARSITTLRRYIRSGRLHAEKRDGRFGPEYFVSEQDLAGAGLAQEPGGAALARTSQRSSRNVPAAAAPRADGVPLTLYQELQMKHEQLLVQYGMIRASGMRAMNLQNENQSLKQELEEKSTELDRQRRRAAGEASGLKRDLRAAHLEMEGRALEIAALEEKVRGLEMLTRNRATNEGIEKQYRDVMTQSRRIGQVRGDDRWPARAKSAPQSSQPNASRSEGSAAPSPNRPPVGSEDKPQDH